MSTLWNNFITWYNPQALSLITPSSEWRFMYAYVGLIGLCAILGLLLLVLKLHPALKAQLSTFFWTQVGIGVFLLFFRYQQIPYLGMDVFRIMQEVSIIVWVVYLIWYVLVPFKQELVADKAVLQREKYLPKAKK